ncbi:hypothetical protein L1887_19005 [Cichorium endivia]|nr:hypothetical protein L1887_19005 [Cichorium endivia]
MTLRGRYIGYLMKFNGDSLNIEESPVQIPPLTLHGGTQSLPYACSNPSSVIFFYHSSLHHNSSGTTRCHPSTATTIVSSTASSSIPPKRRCRGRIRWPAQR